MINVIILAPETSIPSAIVDPQYMFSAVNNFYKQSGQESIFDVKIVGLNDRVYLNNNLVTINTDSTIQNTNQVDLIIIPAISGDINKAIELNKDFIPFLIEQKKGGAEIASLCIGAFLLASSGLLNGKHCSTHWLFANEFREMFPQVELKEDKVITEQDGIYTSGGATSYWNLLLLLVEKYSNKKMAVMASKFFLLDIKKGTQLPFSIFKGQKEHTDNLVLSAQNYIEENFKEKFATDDLAQMLNVGRRTLERRFKSSTKNTIVEYIQRVKVEVAKVELEKGKKTVSEIMHDVGYSDSKSFRDVFKKYAGITPINYKNKYC